MRGGLEAAAQPVRQMPVTLRRRSTSTATGRVMERVMTKAMIADSTSARAMTMRMRIVRCPLEALAAVGIVVTRISKSGGATTQVFVGLKAPP